MIQLNKDLKQLIYERDNKVLHFFIIKLIKINIKGLLKDKKNLYKIFFAKFNNIFLYFVISFIFMHE